jgi:undecaprenyl-phosphate 4-deoxy-4-formamido-L-arabinose transferase
MTFSIVIPVYNSQDSITLLYQKIKEKFKDKIYEIIFVNDKSRDGSLEVLIELMSKDAHIRILDMCENVGQQKALYYGLRLSQHQILITMDDDLQHPIDLLEEMYKKILEGNDLVYGIPTHQHKNPLRRLGSHMTGSFFKRKYPVLKGKSVSSYRMMKRSLLSTLNAPQWDYIYLSALLLKEACRVENVLFDSLKRPYGHSGYSMKKLIVIYLKLNFYYGFKEKFLLNHKTSFTDRKGILYEKDHDFRCRSLSDERHS